MSESALVCSRARNLRQCAQQAYNQFRLMELECLAIVARLRDPSSNFSSAAGAAQRSTGAAACWVCGNAMGTAISDSSLIASTPPPAKTPGAVRTERSSGSSARIIRPLVAGRLLIVCAALVSCQKRMAVLRAAAASASEAGIGVGPQQAASEADDGVEL